MSTELLGTVFGLASAMSWGTGDFVGGMASRRGTAHSVVFVSQLFGAILLAILALFFAEPLPPLDHLLLAFIAGVAGAVGVVSLYRALAIGRMGLVAPITGLVSAALPVAAGSLFEGLPAVHQLAGFLLALIAVWFISQSSGSAEVHLRDLGLPLLAGLGFGLFLIFIDRVGETAILWPLVAARCASLATLALAALLLRRRLWPTRQQLPLSALAGVLDTGGNAFYALAAQVGRLDIAAILSSFYPAATILLARFILEERLTRRQGLGILFALGAVVLITL